MSVLMFFIGLWVGGIVGIFTMCLFQISKDSDDEKETFGVSEKMPKGDLE